MYIGSNSPWGWIEARNEGFELIVRACVNATWPSILGAGRKFGGVHSALQVILARNCL